MSALVYGSLYFLQQTGLHEGGNFRGTARSEGSTLGLDWGSSPTGEEANATARQAHEVAFAKLHVRGCSLARSLALRARAILF